jgi:hypothetical protein
VEIKMAKAMNTSPEAIAKRTDAILSRFRDAPGEFYMLKGLLLLEAGLNDARDTLGSMSYLGGTIPRTGYSANGRHHPGVPRPARTPCPNDGEAGEIAG